MKQYYLPAYGNIPLEELAGLPNYYFPTLSYDKKKIALYWDKTGRTELYVMDAAPGASPRKISNGEVPKSLRAGFVWTRDDQHIIFAKDNDGDEQHNLWQIHIESGEVEQLTDNPDAQEYPIEVSPDNTMVAVLSNKNGQLNLFHFDLAAREYTQITNYDNPVFSSKFSPDGSQIVYIANETDDLKNSDIYLMKADGSDPRRIMQMKVGSQDGAGEWSPDGRYLAIGSDFFGGSRVGVYDLETGETRWLTPEDRTMYAGKFSPDGKHLLVADNVDAGINVVAYHVETGKPVPIELPPGMSYNADWLDDKRFMVNIMTDVSRPELRDYHLDDGSSHVLMPAEYGSIDPKHFSALEYVSFQSSDGLEIHANLYRPRIIESGKKYPAMVEIHGGPTAQFFRSFDPYAQFLADSGYIIIQPNVRGSTGYGVEFRDMAIKDWGGGDLDDVETAAEYLKALPEVDENRIGVWGGSYGGYMTFMAVTKKPNLWKAGMAWIGISDLHSMYEKSMEHFKYYLMQQMGDPVEDADLWRDRSAINFAHQMTCHLLIVHGVNDPRCPIEQARMFRDKLVELGKVEGGDFEYVEFEEVGHASSDIQQKTRMYKQLLDYFDRRL